ncbi:Gfo/Idh/MocA family protein [Adhaeribacter pallidiroseus]|uniref:UDP-N-acetylglucosamine 3-dehydrogenase n=1 Tax=Adhaeribacter pallidiroseus TaxID=2072847 RepID=A0A369QNG2_9BACT|nr:Gfo/Idh/MocA family oxidoreductase [Adhaeribacter pallidiroseus]RDC65910.1 UDP-N-acetylglucosamine 3-dehydrogenase [Adhaeribacter pallidiroseus]
MLKIGVIGLGDIAQKAYLPILSSRSDVEVHLFSNNAGKLADLGRQYRFTNQYANLADFLNSGLDGVMVHAATEAHYPIVEKLLQQRIPVFVDKPITLDYTASKQLVALAEKNNVLLHVGFNRRYAPVYQKLKELAEPTLIIMQKNRQALPDTIRRFVVEDFIHVVDTLRYLFPYPIEDILVHGKKQGDRLYHLVVQLVNSQGIAIGIMNRDTGTTEEKVEIMNAREKRIAYNVADLEIITGKNSTRLGSNDWEPTLQKRGFYAMVDDFFNFLHTAIPPMITAPDALRTHELCERIVEKLTVL